MPDMTTFDRIKELAEKRGKSLPAVSADLKFSDNLFYRWKTSNPKASDLAKVADYFHVSVDYLLGREDIPGDELDEIMNAYGFSDSLKQSIKSTENYSGKPLTEENYKAMADLVNMYLQSVKAENQDK
ncbi:helix-turn-helix transcriptional regulator [Lactococcus petauri]|uniref:helix-turn-helix domain-containing protein n=1 Tax=Lactococcus TaxID=1357 RepID=UPI0024C4E5BF|nr:MULTISPECIES: helix-turn-helix transcriptional regulator [Lactococcus]MDT2574331.1 helix-turn-helix transcriptional regulator [Lactococcus petauri]WKY24611.1 helix-turn-helix transcriptional regulator [Lactococcus sp. bn62]